MLKIDRIALADCFTPHELVNEIFKQCQGLSLPIPLLEIAKQCGIVGFIPYQIKGKPEGVLYADNFKDEAVILYRTHKNNSGRERYSIAHELGHHLLPHHTMTRIYGPEHHSLENEAFKFAELLMLPKHLLLKELSDKTPDLRLFKIISDNAQMSFSATVNRCCDLLSNAVPMIIIHSKDNVCRYVWSNWSAKEYEPYLLTSKKQTLPKKYASDLLSNMSNFFTDISHSSTAVWFDDHSNNSLSHVWEQTYYQENGYMCTMLTLVSNSQVDPKEGLLVK